MGSTVRVRHIIVICVVIKRLSTHILAIAIDTHACNVRNYFGD
jgi:hypothetical protein